MKLSAADKLAEALVENLSPGTERIAVAGSVRRRKPDVKDIELVVIPRFRTEPVPDAQGGLFAPAPTMRVNEMREIVERLEANDRLTVIKPNTQEIIPWHVNDDGKYWRLYLHRQGIKVDVFLQTPETWGLNFLIRTGSGVGPDGNPSSGFAPAMLARWKVVSGGGNSEGARLYRTELGRPEETREEEDVFDLCQVDFVPPDERRSVADVTRNARSIT